ncbi:hypothetical protein TNCV_3680841 [Trichonephila clavipes]|nr:hypothetical protein TNCV_3680841 [Trichonephila clavipes]
MSYVSNIFRPFSFAQTAAATPRNIAQSEVPRAAPIRALLIHSRLSDDSSEDIRKKVTTCLINKNPSVPIIKISSTRSKGVSILLSKENDVDFLEKKSKAIDSLKNFDINRSRLRKPQVIVINVDKSSLKNHSSVLSS